VGKANISFPVGMLEEVDRRADASGTTRSAFIQEATASYIAQLDADQEQAERASRVRRALEGMREIGARLPAGDSGAALIGRARRSGPRWDGSAADHE